MCRYPTAGGTRRGGRWQSALRHSKNGQGTRRQGTRTTELARSRALRPPPAPPAAATQPLEHPSTAHVPVPSSRPPPTAACTCPAPAAASWCRRAAAREAGRSRACSPAPATRPGTAGGSSGRAAGQALNGAATAVWTGGRGPQGFHTRQREQRWARSAYTAACNHASPGPSSSPWPALSSSTHADGDRATHVHGLYLVATGGGAVPCARPVAPAAARPWTRLRLLAVPVACPTNGNSKQMGTPAMLATSG